jgi:hypothetical protein
VKETVLIRKTADAYITLRRLCRRLKAAVKNYRGVVSEVPSWQEIEHFDEAWKQRIKQMSYFIPPGASVVDLGCGKMWLKEFIPDSRYTGVDYLHRGDGCVVVDFNLSQFPVIDADVAFVSGALEYIINPEWFIDEISKHFQMCILSYWCFDDIPDISRRRAVGWVNDLTIKEMCRLFNEKGFRLKFPVETWLEHSIFVFSRSSCNPAAGRDIAVSVGQASAALKAGNRAEKHARNRIRPIGKRKKFLTTLQ